MLTGIRYKAEQLGEDWWVYKFCGGSWRRVAKYDDQEKAETARDKLKRFHKNAS